MNTTKSVTIDKLSQELPVNSLGIKRAALVIRATNHPLRQKLLKTIHTKKQVTVTELYTELGLLQPVASMHLAELRAADFVSVERVGRHLLYSVNYQRLSQVQQLIKDILHIS